MNEREACARGRELTVAISDLLAGVGDDQASAALAEADYIAGWQELRYVGTVLGERSPFRDIPTIWDWFTLCLGDLADPEDRSAWVSARTVAFTATIETIERRLDGNEVVPFEARYYRDHRDEMPVVSYLDGLNDVPVAARIRRRIEFLNKLTPDKPYLARPHGAPLDGPRGDGFFELRVNTGVQHRIIYRPYGRQCILLHALAKKGDEVPEADKLIAFNRWQDLLDRLDQRPDPIGDSAP